MPVTIRSPITDLPNPYRVTGNEVLNLSEVIVPSRRVAARNEPLPAMAHDEEPAAPRASTVADWVLETLPKFHARPQDVQSLERIPTTFLTLFCSKHDPDFSIFLNERYSYVVVWVWSSTSFHNCYALIKEDDQYVSYTTFLRNSHGTIAETRDYPGVQLPPDFKSFQSRWISKRAVQRNYISSSTPLPYELLSLIIDYTRPHGATEINYLVAKGFFNTFNPIEWIRSFKNGYIPPRLSLSHFKLLRITSVEAETVLVSSDK